MNCQSDIGSTLNYDERTCTVFMYLYAGWNEQTTGTIVRESVADATTRIGLRRVARGRRYRRLHTPCGCGRCGTVVRGG